MNINKKPKVKFFKGRHLKVGLPPGSIIYSEDKPIVPLKLQIIHFDQNTLEEKETDDISHAIHFSNTEKITWIDVEGHQKAEDIENFCTSFNIHPLTIEDILTHGQRSKIEDNEDYLFLVIKMLHFNSDDSSLSSEQVSLLLKNNTVISFHEQPNETFEIIKNRLRQNKGRIRNKKADYLFYSLIDTIVDYYFVVLEKFGDKLEELEDDLVEDPSLKTLKALHMMKKESIILRRSVWPLREVINKLERGDIKFVEHGTHIFFRDVYDHTIQVIETIETFRDMVGGMMDLYQSTTSNKLNQVMKALTIFSTIFLPLTFITGLYGMNFDYIPELHWRYGYLAVWGVLLSIITVMLVLFRKNKWI